MRHTINAPNETVLVVANDEVILQVVSGILVDARYRVIPAADPEIAIAEAKAWAGTIDLLLSTVDLPGMSGPDLGETLKISRPKLRVMLMAGGFDGNLLILNYGWAFIQQPSVPMSLVKMVRAVLDTPNRSQLGGQQFDNRQDSAKQKKLPRTLAASKRSA
jgi:DNA-binding NtrC family response regulator